ncbi:unnamed protein product (macronuclear) [Paramecium tetraurelia]|uniref:Uncharacterized protein n=1 Tax=Paramecium tetraurelia TaxID=5888 RepID=A0C1I6_PARTE|nr:uncharacterized protein GSPATT00034129001 [Paramecium tetraurelia]CAK64653.1 unnamed protein product [Paramecium tetraurelia]|eukprot:XP_001432050.1 hypothetical protein (macronuclear) [Paramecium tetraurelia strain d4-2]
MEDFVSPTHSIQMHDKFVTRLEKLQKLFDNSVQRKDQQHIILQQLNITMQDWADIQSSYKELEKAHNEFNITNIGKQKKMDQTELDMLRIIVGLYCNAHNLQPLSMNVYDWDQVGQILFNRHWKVCRSRWVESQATSIVDHPWTREEDSVLSQLYNKYAEQNRSNKWSLIAMEMSKICNSSNVRLGKQCRERWINKLNPQVERGPWYKEDEIKLLVAVLQYGKKWSQISRRDFENLRTENCLKNRFHTIIKRESTKFEQNSQQSKKQIYSKLKLEDEQQLIEQIIQELREESLLQQQSVECNKLKQKFKLTQTDQLLDFLNNNFQIAIIKKNKLSVLC